MSSIILQLHINRLPIPEDVQEEIKSYCFYDSVSGKTKMVKKKILKVISNAISSVNNVDLQLEEDEIDEWFLFAVKEKENWPFNTIQHQIIFCNCCGNYLHFSSFEDHGHATQKVKCSCF